MKKFISILLILLVSILPIINAEDTISANLHQNAYIMGLRHGETYARKYFSPQAKARDSDGKIDERTIHFYKNGKFIKSYYTKDKTVRYNGNNSRSMTKKEIMVHVADFKKYVRDEASIYDYENDKDFYQFYLGFRTAVINYCDLLMIQVEKKNPNYEYQNHYDIFRCGLKLGQDLKKSKKYLEIDIINLIKEMYSEQAKMFAYGCYFGYFGTTNKNIDIQNL